MLTGMSVVDTNLKGAWLASREAAQRWVTAKRPGNIINIASILGQRVVEPVLALCEFPRPGSSR